jgi:DNA-directed RNA polymerase specialized sigma24 family protein
MSTNPDRVPTDAELLAAVAERDPEAFGTLYDQHAPWLLVRLRQRTTNQDLADQVAQETFLVVWRDAGRFRGRGEVGAWIWGIAIRRLLDTQRGDPAHRRLPSWLRGLTHWLTRGRAARAVAGPSGSPDAAGRVERSVG